MKFLRVEKETGTEPRLPKSIIHVASIFMDVASTSWLWKPKSYAIFSGPKHADPGYAPELRNRTSSNYSFGKNEMISLSERFRSNSLSPAESKQGWSEVEINRACLALDIRPLSLAGI